MAFRILSIDGGGLRGLVPVLILKHIQSLTEREHIVDSFDMLAGTSTGALITAGLSVVKPGETKPKHTLDDLERVYVQRGQEIFPKPGWIGTAWHAITDFFRPRFSPDGLNKVLVELLHEGTGNEPRILDCCRPLFITTYDLATNSPLFFKSRAAYEDPSKNVRLIDACRATSAAPTYLPPYSFPLAHAHGRATTEQVTCVDGGMFMNNPAMGALVEILKHRSKPYYNLSGLVESDIFVLSIGTGRYTRSMTNRVGNWGKANWIKPSLDIMMWGNSQAVDYHVSEGLTFSGSGKLNYMRLNVDILEERYADMANSDPEMVSYLRSRVEADYLNNASLQDDLARFIRDAGL